jgi:hypothetical protein
VELSLETGHPIRVLEQLSWEELATYLDVMERKAKQMARKGR